jgi:hypothetical protein
MFGSLTYLKLMHYLQNTFLIHIICVIDTQIEFRYRQCQRDVYGITSCVAMLNKCYLPHNVRIKILVA